MLQLKGRGWVLLVALVLLATVAVVGAAPVQTGEDAPPTLTVNGSARVTVAPDTAYVTLGVVTEAGDAAGAQVANSKKVQAIYTALAEKGIKKEDMKTVSYNLHPLYDYDKKPPRITAYRVENLVEVRVRPLDKLGELLAVTGSEGANIMRGLRFAAELNQEAARAQALEEATLNARRQAETVARALGAKLGTAKTVNVQIDSPEAPQPLRRESAKVAEAPIPEVPVSPGEAEVWASVNIVFKLE